MFIKLTDQFKIFVLVYVDVIIITRSNKEAISQVINQLRLDFHLNDLGKIKLLFGSSGNERQLLSAF